MFITVFMRYIFKGGCNAVAAAAVYSCDNERRSALFFCSQHFSYEYYIHGRYNAAFASALMPDINHTL